MSDPTNPHDPERRPSSAYDTGTNGLPNFPGSTPAEPAHTARSVPQPSSISLAVRLMWAGAAVSLLSLVVTLLNLGDLKSQVREQLAASGQEVTDQVVNASYAAAIAFGVLGSLIAVLLWLWMAWKNGQGRTWARVVATVLGVINVLSTIYTLTAGTAPIAANILAVINVVLAVVILVLLWRKESSAFYQAQSRPVT